MTKIVRTPSKATGGITPAEKKLLDSHTAKWIKNAMSTEPVNPVRLTQAIKDLYADSGLKEPRVVIVSSPRVKGEPKKGVSLRLTAAQIQKLDEIREPQKLSKTHLIVNAVAADRKLTV